MMDIKIYIEEDGTVTITDLAEDLLGVVVSLSEDNRLSNMNTELCG